jgi:hypothetical protein
MKRMHNRVNLIPLIAKADTLTAEEISVFKQRVGLNKLLLLGQMVNNGYIDIGRYFLSQNPNIQTSDNRRRPSCRQGNS